MALEKIVSVRQTASAFAKDAFGNALASKVVGLMQNGVGGGGGAGGDGSPANQVNWDDIGDDPFGVTPSSGSSGVTQALATSSGNAGADAHKAIAVAKQVEEESYITDVRDVVSNQYDLVDEVVVTGYKDGSESTSYVNHAIHAHYNPNFWGDKKPKPYVAPKFIDMGKVLTDFGMLTVGGTIGGVAGAAVKLGGYTGAALSGYIAGGVGDLTVQGGNNALYALSNGNLGSKGFDKAEFALSTTLGAVLGPAAKGLSDKFGNVPYTSQINSILDNAATNSKTTFSNLYPDDAIGAPLKIFSPEQISRDTFTRKLNYVVKEDGTLVLGKQQNDVIGGGHIDLAGGLPVKAAGEVRIVKGEIHSINNASGHYQPRGALAQDAALNAFENLGLKANGRYIEKY